MAVEVLFGFEVDVGDLLWLVMGRNRVDMTYYERHLLVVAKGARVAPNLASVEADALAPRRALGDFNLEGISTPQCFVGP